MQIAVASGKGGTGKTTVSLALVTHLARSGNSVSILDCDVEEPNVNLFLHARVTGNETVTVRVPVVDDNICDGCGRCRASCSYNAIVMIKDKPLIFADMCHSCGGCALACPVKAIGETSRETGIVESGKINGIQYHGGRLNIGEPVALPVIKTVKDMPDDSLIRIIDCPPGTSCPVIESVRRCDYLILVTEPTPFGLHDLSLAVDMARALNRNFGIVINRSDDGDSIIDNYCDERSIRIIGRIPHSMEIARAYSRGEIIETILDIYGGTIGEITRQVLESVGEKRP